MKRRRNSAALNEQTVNKEAEKTLSGDVQVQREGLSITDLPSSIIENILCRLSVKRIFNCRCVCKSWGNLISSHEFAKLHFERAQPMCTLIRTGGPNRVSRTLYLVEPEDDCGFDFDECDNHVHMKLDTKFKLPFLDSNMVLGKKDYPNVSIYPASCAKKQLFVGSSCNGLLCLFVPNQKYPIVVCNPLTGEYIELPEASKPSHSGTLIASGLGYSPKTKQYKVIRMFDEWKCHPTPGKKLCHPTAEILTLGTGSWRSVPGASYSPRELKFPTYLNGALHWLRVDIGNVEVIICFDIENEQFHSVPSRPAPDQPFMTRSWDNISMGVLRGCIFISEASLYNPIDIWVMKEYGVKESWTREFCIDSRPLDMWPYGLYYPIKYLENGALLMFNPTFRLICYPTETGFKFFTLREIQSTFEAIAYLQSTFEAIAYVPSFISLKDSVMGDHVEVLNIKSRFADVNLKEEAEDLFFVEEYGELISDSYYSSYDSEEYF